MSQGLCRPSSFETSPQEFIDVGDVDVGLHDIRERGSHPERVDVLRNLGHGLRDTGGRIDEDTPPVSVDLLRARQSSGKCLSNQNRHKSQSNREALDRLVDKGS